MRFSLVFPLSIVGLAAACQCQPPPQGEPDEVYIPGASFQMGHDRLPERDSCTQFNRDPCNDFAPKHLVTLDAFFIDKIEVSNREYRKCVDEGICPLPGFRGSYAPEQQRRYNDEAYLDYPVLGAGWPEAQRYCQWKGRRLPTEAEWELAARGTGGRDFPWGNDAPTCERLPEMCDPPVSTGWRADRMRPVGTTPGDATPEGVLDLIGNARELVADFYSDSYYASSPQNNPQGPPAPGGVPEDSFQYRSTRGAWFLHEPRDWSIAMGAPAWARDSSVSLEGFRCARTVTKVGVIPTYRAIAWKTK
jgi:formylglycine-generating enzyme required for sulfatase activity